MPLTQYPARHTSCYRQGRVAEKGKVVGDDEYLNNEFITKAKVKVAKRGADFLFFPRSSMLWENLQQHPRPGLKQAAAAACEHVHDWWNGNVTQLQS